jgi:hypothetical protein
VHPIVRMGSERTTLGRDGDAGGEPCSYVHRNLRKQREGVQPGDVGTNNSMCLCCPPGIGCNASEYDEPCALELCYESAAEAPPAALAVARWEIWQASRASASKGERRFNRRAYERARDYALAVLLVHARRSYREQARRPKPMNDRGGPVLERTRPNDESLAHS